MSEIEPAAADTRGDLESIGDKLLWVFPVEATPLAIDGDTEADPGEDSI